MLLEQLYSNFIEKDQQYLN